MDFDVLPIIELQAGKLKFLVQLGLLTPMEEMQLEGYAAYDGRGVLVRDLYRTLKTKWAAQGFGNTLNGILRHLEEMAARKDRREVNRLLYAFNGLKIRGTIASSPRPKPRYRDFRQQHRRPTDGADRERRVLERAL